MRCYILLPLLPAAGLAFQLPFKVPFFKNDGSAPLVDGATLAQAPRVAIIGAGAGGTSAAFWISKAKERFGLDVEIDIYEKSTYVGGRSTTVHPYGNTSLPPLELGASIFVSANKNLWRASDEFNLIRRDFNEESDTTGVWDGEQMVVSFGDSWWDTVKLVWRYGLFSPRRTDTLVADMIKKFVTLYTPESPRWNDIADLATVMGWSEMTGTTTEDFFTGQGISETFLREVIEAATRVNYGQDVNELHALEGACSLATSGAAGIQGGNFLIFENFLKHSGAKLYLNTTVLGIHKTSASSNPWKVETASGVTNYKAVILAAPFHSTNIVLPSSLSDQIPKQPYVHLHVTLLTTTSPTPNPAYFAQSPDSQLPSMILTTAQGFRNGGKEPEFNSLSYHGLVREGEWAVKIFSKQRMSDEWLNTVFSGKVGWVYRKEWDAYPKLPPTSSFPPVKLDEGFYYVNAFEPFISTMETETISSRNVVDLLLKEQFDSGICPPRGQVWENGTSTSTAAHDKDFVYGWDC